ncbi:MAG: 3'(2'),5'-bisphosphate nucleotidase [Deltaproteobacteria bacterium]|nr:3'(2'),5'-bisphosphate nucleotidase [Deltaproteobacteria bacterium]MBW2016916.1 3'(2'),5'-bisphosphate nucleotidase [Deltaproteobacteria bacterium]MBW2129380.1 3'(2'),5'-bisphosphate nucleotidase [Deltaproteobacteria bacterium]MBW2303722.1 3'(2'),5'-bisphosphate nucleotidase [Deltaproteobacteria bacterium]
MSRELEREVAVRAVLKACRLCRNVQSEHMSRQKVNKTDGSPVTVADFGGQALVSHHLSMAFPADPLMGEESSDQLLRRENGALKESVIQHVRRIVPELDEEEILAAIDRGNASGGPSGRFWVLDPVDGTKGFLRGAQYAVALALVEDGEVTLGVLGCPNLPLVLDNPGGHPGQGCLFFAAKGEGAFMRPLDEEREQRITVSLEERPSGALFAESFESEHSSHKDSARLAKMLGVTREPLRMDGQGKYGLVARGEATIYLRVPVGKEYAENIWDHAAGAVIVEEAGGKVTDLDGLRLDFSRGKKLEKNRGILASNGRLHDTVLEALEGLPGQKE